MKNIKLLILFFVFLPLITAAQGLDFTTVTTPVLCVNDGSITVTVSNEVGHVQYELVNYSGTKKRSVIGVPQDNPIFLNLAPGTYTVGVYDDNNATTPITKEVIVPNNGPEKTLTISSIYSNQLAYCGTDTNPGSLLRVVPSGGRAPYIITVLDTNDVMIREATSYSSYDFLSMPAGTYKIRVKDNCGTVVNSNSPHVIAPNIVYNFTLATPMYWYWDNNVKVIHSGTGTICDPVTDAYYDFSYPGGVPVITGNDVYPIYQAPGITKMYAVEYDGVKTPYMTYNELIAYKQPLPIDINTWKPMTLWVTICGIERSTVYNLTSRRNDFLPKPIANAGVTFYVADDVANTLCTPTGYVTLSRYSLLSGFCDPLTLTVTEKNGVVPPKQYTITGANQNDFEAQLAIGNTYILKLTDANGSELNRFSYINVTRGQRTNLYSRDEIFIDPVNFRPANQDELPIELGTMADFKNFGKSQIGIRDYAMPKPYTAAITGPNGFYMEKVVSTSDNFVGTLLSNNLMLGDYSVRITSATACYDKTFPITLDRAIDGISVTTRITPDPVSCDRYVKTFDYKIINRGTLRPYPNNVFEEIFKAPFIGFKVIDGPAGYTQTNAIVNNTYGWGMAITPTVTAAFRGDITGLYKINLVDYYTPTNVYGGPWELDVKSEFPVFDMNGSGGTICTGSTTGTLSIAVKNATSPMYYLKKAADANYPTVGQSSPDFPNLTVGDYMVKVETACYPTALEATFKMDYASNIGSVILGENNLCDSDTLNLSLKSIGPIANVEWKLPDGTTQTGNALVLTNPQAGQYSVNVTTRSGCVIPDTIEVKVNRNATATDITGVNQTICEGTGAEILVLSSIANPIFTWYSDAALTNVIATGENYGVTPISTTTYYVTVQGDNVCENAPNTAKEIVITVNPNPGTPTGNATQEFCLTSNALVSDLVTNENNVIWYDATSGGNVISVGTALINGTIYYGSLTVGTCESITRLAVTAIINEAGTPTGNATQEFCLGSNALVSDLVTNESNVIWYDAATGGNVVSAGTTLVNGTIYYGSLTAGTCESIMRLAVTAIINEAATPTGNATQEFCLASNALVSDLVTNENNVIWYDAATGGNVVSAGTTLVNGTIYYGSLTAGTCESIIRLAVTAVIKADLPGETIGWKATTCITEEVTYKTTTAMSDYNWIVTGGTIKAGGQLSDDFVTVIWTTAGNGSVEVAFINPSNCNPIVTIHFPVSVSVCSDIAIGKTVNNPTPTIGENVIFTITATNIGTSDFQHVSIDEMLPSGYSYVISTTTSGTYNSSNGVWNLPVLDAGKTETLTLTAKVKGTGDYLNIASLNASTPTDPNQDNNRAEASVTPTGVIIYNAVSANGDGINDYFKIEGLEHYPDNTVEIYNRWGVKIYETNGYGSNDNVFRSISDGRATVEKGNVVPAGTYFYILRYQTNAETRIEKSGYLYVN
jgi:uncharacterized repeat protein (TIGR01451 family)/gliding motility-associated-like protein